MTIITKDRGSYTQEKPFDPQRFYNFIQELYEETSNKEKIDKKIIDDIYKEVLDFIQSKSKVEAVRLFDYIIRETNN
ncbi:ribonucleoside-diphosphate reductase alpha subunit [Bacillus phage QCM8]|nr:ribonucleoside-diphosphate reductase alpha subunit [Bacillus phage QCM8]